MGEDKVGVTGVAERKASLDEMGKDKVVVVKTTGDQKAVSLMNVFEGSALLEEGDKVRNSHWSGLIAASSPLLLKQN